jgi:hypothetical protein
LTENTRRISGTAIGPRPRLVGVPPSAIFYIKRKRWCTPDTTFPIRTAILFREWVTVICSTTRSLGLRRSTSTRSVRPMCRRWSSPARKDVTRPTGPVVLWEGGVQLQHIDLLRLLRLLHGIRLHQPVRPLVNQPGTVAGRPSFYALGDEAEAKGKINRCLKNRPASSYTLFFFNIRPVRPHQLEPRAPPLWIALHDRLSKDCGSTCSDNDALDCPQKAPHHATACPFPHMPSESSPEK